MSKTKCHFLTQCIMLWLIMLLDICMLSWNGKSNRYHFVIRYGMSPCLWFLLLPHMLCSSKLYIWKQKLSKCPNYKKNIEWVNESLIKHELHCHCLSVKAMSYLVKNYLKSLLCYSGYTIYSIYLLWWRYTWKLFFSRPNTKIYHVW